MTMESFMRAGVTLREGWIPAQWGNRPFGRVARQNILARPARDGWDGWSSCRTRFAAGRRHPAGAAGAWVAAVPAVRLWVSPFPDGGSVWRRPVFRAERLADWRHPARPRGSPGGAADFRWILAEPRAADAPGVLSLPAAEHRDLVLAQRGDARFWTAFGFRAESPGPAAAFFPRGLVPGRGGMVLFSFSARPLART